MINVPGSALIRLGARTAAWGYVEIYAPYVEGEVATLRSKS